MGRGCESGDDSETASEGSASRRTRRKAAGASARPGAASPVERDSRVPEPESSLLQLRPASGAPRAIFLGAPGVASATWVLIGALGSARFACGEKVNALGEKVRILIRSIVGETPISHARRRRKPPNTTCSAPFCRGCSAHHRAVPSTRRRLSWRSVFQRYRRPRPWRLRLLRVASSAGMPLRQARSVRFWVTARGTDRSLLRG